MNKVIDYSEYNITATAQFRRGLAQLKEQHFDSEVAKLFRIIDEIICGVNMYEKEYSRPLKNSDKIHHIHLDGRRTGDIILLYRADGEDIELDLKLYNISDHKSLSHLSNKRVTKNQILSPFDVVPNKYSRAQLSYAEECYLNLIADYKFHQLSGDQKTNYSDQYISTYFENTTCSDTLTFDEFIQIIRYFENIYHKPIRGSLDFQQTFQTAPITEQEERFIMGIFRDYDVYIHDAYIETEVDGYGDTYITMYVEITASSFQCLKLLESDLYCLKTIYGIKFEVNNNGLGKYGRTYEFNHYFI